MNAEQEFNNEQDNLIPLPNVDIDKLPPLILEPVSKQAPVKRSKGRPKKNPSDDNQATDKTKTKKGKQTKGFRLASKNVLLTYPQCPIPIQIFAERFLGTPYFIKNGVLNYAFVVEMHEDGNPHIHALIEFDKKIDTKNPHYFDVKVLENQFDPAGQLLSTIEHNYHGSYEGAKKKTEALQYLTKEIFTPYEAMSRLRLSPGFSLLLGNLYQYLSLEMRMIALAERGQIPEALDRLKTEDPKEYVYRGSAIEKRLQEIHLKSIGCKAKYPFDSFTIPDDIKEVLEVFEGFIKVGEAKTLVVQGLPGTGKTEFLKAYFEQVLNLNVLVINHKEGLKEFDINRHKAIIFDDPQFRDLTREELIALTDSNEQSIKVRYTMVRIPANTPKAIAVNYPPGAINHNFGDKAVDRRIMLYVLNSKQTFLPNENKKLLNPNEEKDRLESKLKDIKENQSKKKSG